MQEREPRAGAGLVAALVQGGSTPFRFRPALARLVGMRPSEVQAIALPGRFGAAPPVALPPRPRALAAIAPAPADRDAGLPAEPEPRAPRATLAASVIADDAHLPSPTSRPLRSAADLASAGRTFDVRVPAGVAPAARPALAAAAPTPAPRSSPERAPSDAPAALPLASAAAGWPSPVTRMTAPASDRPSRGIDPPPQIAASVLPPLRPCATLPAAREPAAPVIDLRAALARHVAEHLAPRVALSAALPATPPAPVTLATAPATMPAPPAPLARFRARIDAAAPRPPELTVADSSAPSSASAARPGSAAPARVDLDVLHARHGTSPLAGLSQRQAADPRLQSQVAEMTREVAALRQGARDAAARANARIATAEPAPLAAARLPTARPAQPPSDASWARRRTGPMRFRVSR